MRLSTKIKKLLDDPQYSAYKIAKESGVPQSTVSDTRNGKRSVENMTLQNAEKLENFIEKNKK